MNKTGKLLVSKKRTLYNSINILVILLTAALFVYEYKDINGIFSGFTCASLPVLAVTVVLVHIVKAGRLFLALYGLEIACKDFIKAYCKVTPVSVIIPFKLGEFFRMYCYGTLIGNVFKGIVIILLDRFMDTMALVTVIILVWMINGGSMASFVYTLFVFLVFVLIIYFVYPGVYKFWKKYLLKAKASEYKLSVLRLLERLNTIYCEVENVAKGRGIILYFMSLIAWGVEIGSLYILNGIKGQGQISNGIYEYLTSAMSGSQSSELKRFVIASVVLLIVIYLIIKAGEMLIGKKDRQ